jgi:hypothetical protein
MGVLGLNKFKLKSKRVIFEKKGKPESFEKSATQPLATNRRTAF